MIREIEIPDDFPRQIAAGEVNSDRVMNPFNLHLEVGHYPSSIELRFYGMPDEDGYLRDWIGQSVTIHRSETTFAGGTWDAEVRPAYITHSTGDSNPKPIATDVDIWLLVLADEVRAAVEGMDAPRVEEELAQYKEERRKIDEQIKARERLAAQRAAWAEAVWLDGRQVRVTTSTGRQKSGTLRLDGDRKFLLSGVEVPWATVARLETKPIGSKYAAYQQVAPPMPQPDPEPAA